jgi:transposase, IS6 family
MLPAAWHHVERYANNRVEADHAQLKRRLRPMRGIKTMTGLRVLAAGHAFVQNLRRGHYEIATDLPAQHRLAAAFSQLARAI